MRLSTVLLASLAFAAIAKTHVPDPRLTDGALTRRGLKEGKVCRFFQQNSLLLNDNLLYIDYAYMTRVAEFNPSNQSVHLVSPFYYHLSKPGNLESLSTGGNEIASTQDTRYWNPNNTWKVPPILGGAIYFSGQPEDKIVKYGGAYTDPSAFNISHSVGRNEWWTLDNASREWATITPKGSRGLLRADGMASVNAPAQGLAFSIGGFVTNWTDSAYKEWNLAARDMLVLPSMLIYNTRKHEVENVTISPLPAQWGGVVEYIPIGKKGVLVLIGGFESENTIAAITGNKLKDMKEIHLYDIDTRKWHTQITQGSIPNNRAFACASIASAPDNSSHNIFVHGGTDGSLTTYSNTYVLSLPSFEWIKADSGSDTQSRLGHNCHMTTGHKMLVIGGRGRDQGLPIGPDWDGGECDKYAVINVFDTSTLRWQDSWDPNDESTKFKVNKVITAVIGGNESGGATVRKPKSGWESEAVRMLFEESPGASPGAGPPPSAPQGSSDERGAGHAMRANVGAVELISMAVIVAVMAT